MAKWISRAISLARYFCGRQALEDELDEELRSYFDMLVDRYVAQGMSPENAKRTARMEFEGMEQTKERVRERFTGAALGTALQDGRYAWRALRKSPTFSVIAIVTLALGIGLNAAVFSVVYAVLLRPLPFDRPEQLGLIWSNFQQTGAQHAPTSGVILGELERRNRSLQDVAGIWVGTGIFTGEQNPEQVKLAQVTPNFFQTLGAHAALGRTFLKEESFGGRPAVILADGLWKRRFGGDPAIVGKPVPFQGRSATVVGVLPPDFQLFFPAGSNVPADVQAFAPFGNNIYKDPRQLYYIRVVARLKNGVTFDQAQQDLDRVAAEIRAAYTEFAEEKVSFTLSDMHAEAERDIRPAIIALFVGATFLMLICSVNVSSLLLARASDRRQEMALRAALGASRGRIVRQLLAEGVVLCAIAWVGGLAVAWAGMHALLRIRPERLAHIAGVGLNWHVLAFAAMVSMCTVILFALAPAAESMRLDLVRALREGRTGQEPLRRRMGTALVIAEIMLGFVLVIGSGLSIRTVAKVREVRPGFEPNNLLTFQMALGRFANFDAYLNGQKQWEAKLLTLPGVEQVGAVSHLPLDDFPNWYSPYGIEGKTTGDAAASLADYRCITPGYFDAMGVRLLKGRFFNVDDRAGGQQVVIVDEMLARTAWPGQSAIGKKIEAEHVTGKGFQPVWSEVVGVVEHVRNHSLTRQVRGEIYVPFEQSPRSPLSYVVRTRLDPLALAPVVGAQLRAMDPNLALSKVRPMAAYVEQDIEPLSFTAVLAGTFAGLALLLAAIGVYGVLNYQVSRRMPEMGLRMALGANGRDVMGLILRQGLLPTALGLLLGVTGTVAVSHYLQALIFGVSVTDPVTYSSAVFLLAVAAAAGCWWPASKAARANPLDSIRAE